MNELDAVLNSYSGEVVELVQSLVKYPSVLKPPQGNEKECQMFVADWLGDYCDLVDVFELPEAPGFLAHPAHWKYNEYAERPDVVGVVYGSGGGKSLLFNGHVDVVPEDPLPWVHAPFGAEITNNRIYGRGAADCKGGLGACMLAVKMIKRAGLRLKGDLIIQSVVGEEYAGANGTLAAVLRGYTADAGISVEPSGMVIGTSTRCGRLYEFRVFRDETMFMASGQDLNPATLIGHLINGVEAFNRLRNLQKPDNEVYHDFSNPQPASVVKIKAGQIEPGGLIGIPREAWMHAWIYGMPEVTEADLDREVKEFFEDWIQRDSMLDNANVTISPHTRFLEGSVVPSDHSIVELVKEKSLQDLGYEIPVGPTSVTGDLGILDHWGSTPTIVLGPRGGNIHDSDEYVDINDLIDLVSIYAHTIIDWCGIEEEG